ncbi:MAG: glycine oxidase ThiO [Deltaproteobacteria bacterium]|nr:glycine oxidase ThiO [Deltaproteobacteria bacterium]
MRDVAVVGGGVVGLASALALARRGLSVTVLERDPGATRAASRAAAGMLSAQLERHPSSAMAELCLAGRERHRAFLDELTSATGRDLDHREVGALRVATDDASEAELHALVGEQRARGWDAQLLTNDEARRLEPGLGDVRVAGWFPGERVVDPPRLVDALVEACAARGVELRDGHAVVRLEHGAEGVRAHLDTDQLIGARHLVLTAGAWSGVLEGAELAGLIRPIRGQMLEMRSPTVPTRLLEGRGGYLSPRSDGRVLAGSTLEDVGFEQATTEEARRALYEASVALFPALASAEVSSHWSGFRSRSPDHLPLLGVTAAGLVVATGHYRNGIVLSAITADIVVALVLGEPPPVDLAPFAPTRFA